MGSLLHYYSSFRRMKLNGRLKQCVRWYVHQAAGRALVTELLSQHLLQFWAWSTSFRPSSYQISAHPHYLNPRSQPQQSTRSARFFVIASELKAVTQCQSKTRNALELCLATD